MRTRAIPRGCDATPVGAAPQQVQLLVTAPAVGDVVLEVMPQRDGELAGKSYDGDAPHASLLGRRRARGTNGPAHCRAGSAATSRRFDHRGPGARIAGLADPC